MRILHLLAIFHCCATLSLLAVTQAFKTDPQAVAQCLASLDTWIIAQPKAVRALPDASFPLNQCQGIVVEASGDLESDLGEQASTHIASVCGVHLPVIKGPASGPMIKLQMIATPQQFPQATGLGPELFDIIGDQGYAVVIDSKQVVLAARSIRGMRHALTTLGQIAADRTVLPGLAICDWPSLKYRGAQQDISRGQVPTPATLKRLAAVLAQAKMNVLELYIEHEYKFKAFPDISPPEGLAPAEAKDLSRDAARHGVEVHPLLQTLGHSYHILSKPQYQHLRVGPCEKAPWIMTFDVRKPEAVRMVTTMIDELCEVFPGELFNVDITEIDIDGLQTNGVTLVQATDLVFNYVGQLNEAVRRHGRRLMIAQGPLDSQGHLAGMGPKLDALPKEIIVGSYYCAGGPYQPAWEKDFPRLREKRFDFFAQAWIYSHVWLTPWVKHAAEFSDLEVLRGVRHGATGSITTDWGDAGHFHFVGEEWLPFLYHGACAWTGAQLDREYFRRAVSRGMYGLTNDAALRAMEAASDINAKPIRVRDQEGKESEITTSFIWEFVHDPFTHPDLTRIANPAAVGQALLNAAGPALATLSATAPQAKRNRDNLDQWIFGVRCYAALGRKLVALGHHNDPAIPRLQVAEELEAVAKEYESLRSDFKRLWLAEDRDNDGFQELVRRFSYTVVPCREKAKALRDQSGPAAGLGPSTLSIEEGQQAIKVKSPCLDLQVAATAPKFLSLTVDSLGLGKTRTNALRPGSLDTNAWQVRRETTATTLALEFRRPGTPATTEPAWRFEISARSIRLISQWNERERPESLVFDFDPKLCHVTLLGTVNADSSVQLPALLHLPHQGTLRVSAAGAPTAALGYDARRAGDGYVKVTIPPATQAHSKIQYDWEVVTVHPQMAAFKGDARFDGFRRNWLNIFQVNPRLRVLANHAASDTCAFCLYEYADIARYTPPLAEGLSALDLVRQSLDRYLEGLAGYGLPGNVMFDAEGAPSQDPPYLDSYPSLLIAAGDYVAASGDGQWLQNRYDGLRAWAEKLLAMDHDGNGLFEYPYTGNSGSWSGKGEKRPSNWWDTIGFGHEDAYANALAYRALRGMEGLAARLGKTAAATRYRSAAGKLRDAYFKAFFNPATGVLAGWRSADGNLHDYYFLFVNGIAIHYGLVPKEQANPIMDRLLAKLKAVGYTRFDLGLPGNLVPVPKKDYVHQDRRWGGGQREDGTDGFQIYENGGATACFAYFTLAALYDLGRQAEADRILFPMLEAFERGAFQGQAANGMSNDWKAWDGTPWGYEGFLVDNYYALLAVLAREKIDQTGSSFGTPPPHPAE